MLETALKQQNQGLVLLQLCNGYNPNREPRRALDVALDDLRGPGKGRASEGLVCLPRERGLTA